MSATNLRGYSFVEAIANLTPTYPAASGAGHATGTAGSSTTSIARLVLIHSISVTSAVAGNSVLVQNHAGSLTYFTIGAATTGCYIIDAIVESGFRLVGGSAGTATALVTYVPLSN